MVFGYFEIPVKFQRNPEKEEKGLEFAFKSLDLVAYFQQKNENK